jgi:pimeloyl-ACP methyl ester carboxylesterase
MLSGQTDQQKLDVLGTRLAVYRSGDGDPAVVFVSGLGDPAAVWQTVTTQLERRTTVLSYDRAGCGSSEDLREAVRPRPSSWAAEQLYHLLSAADLDRGPIVLVGHSVGGQIADAFAVRWPDRVAGLVLVDPADPTLNLVIDPARPVLDDADPTRAGTGWRWDVAASAEEYLTSAPTDPPPAVVVASAVWRWFQARQPELYRPLSLAEVDQRWQLAQLNYARRWQAALVIAHEAGHRVHVEAPDLVSVTISAVIEAAAAARPLLLDPALVTRHGGSVRPTGIGHGSIAT